MYIGYRTILKKFLAFCNFVCLFVFKLHILLCLIIFPIFTYSLSLPSSNAYLKFMYLYLALIYFIHNSKELHFSLRLVTKALFLNFEENYFILRFFSVSEKDLYEF